MLLQEISHDVLDVQRPAQCQKLIGIGRAGAGLPAAVGRAAHGDPVFFQQLHKGVLPDLFVLPRLGQLLSQNIFSSRLGNEERPAVFLFHRTPPGEHHSV